MAVTAGDIIRRVRALLQDSTTPFRYADVDMFDSVNDALDRMVELRPDYFIGIKFAPAAVTSLASVLTIPTRLIYPMTLFTSGYMMLREDEFSTDGRANALLGAAGFIVTRTPGDTG